MVDIGSQHFLAESVMAGRDRRMGSEQRRAPYEFQRFPVGKVMPVYVFPQPFETGKCSMPFIAMIYIAVYAKSPESPYTAYAEQQFLLEPVFPLSRFSQSPPYR